MSFRAKRGISASIAAKISRCARKDSLLLAISLQLLIASSVLAQTPNDSAHSATQPLELPMPLPTNVAEIEQGHRLFSVHCAACHGPAGEGARGPTLAQPNLPRAGDDASLYRIVREGISGSEMPRTRLERPDVARVAAYVKSLGARPPEKIPGDPQRGAELYQRKGQCATCHSIRGQGGAFGGDLSDIGLRRSAAHLRRSIVDPNAEVPQSFSAFRSDVSLPNNFLYVRVETRDGRKIDGVRVNEDTFSIQIREVPGTVHSLFKSELKALHKDYGKSPMPSYDKVFAPDELDDLVAYLASLRDQK